MTKLRLSLTFAFLAACGSTTDIDGGGSPGDGGPTDVPLTIAPLLEPLPDGGDVADGVRLVVQFDIGDSGVSAFLDTGSAGVQVIASSLSPQALAAITPLNGVELSEEFESGIVASGVVSQATISVGGRATEGPIPILLIQSITCGAGADCNGFTSPLSDYLFQGYAGAFGVGMRNSPQAIAAGFGNPVVQLPGEPAYVVEVPSFGATAGTLHIAPTSAEVSKFTTFQLPADAGGAPLSNGVPAWDDTALPACVDNSGQSFCGNAILDTGSPETVIFWTGVSVPEELQPGATAEVVVGPSGAPLGTFNVTVGDPPQPGLDEFLVTAPVPGAGNLLNLGMTVFYKYDIYFDQVHGLIGLSSH